MRHTQVKCTSVSESGCPGGRLYPFQAAETGQLLPEAWTRSLERRLLFALVCAGELDPPEGCSHYFLLSIFSNPSL